MRLIEKLSVASSLLATLTVPALAGVTVSTPANNTEVVSPFTLTADAATCSSEPVDAITYSIDNGTDIQIVKDTSLNESVSTGLGAHTIHVKAWGNKGALCVTDVKITASSESVVTPEGETQSSSVSIPGYAASNSSIQTHSNWQMVHDSATPGSASGSMSLVGSPSHNGTARKFVTHFSGSGGERYSDSFGEDTSASNFVYDGWVYVSGSSSNLGNLELDLNQVLDNGDVMIYSFQCSGHAGVWEYGENAGSAKHSSDHWIRSSVSCNPKNWGANTWHHVQIASSRNSSGHITYKSITFDGTQHTLNKTVFGQFALGWGKVLQTNFQVDGIGSGSTTLYLDDLTVYHW